MYSPIYGPPSPNALSELAARHLTAMRRELAAGRYAAARVFARFAADSQARATLALDSNAAIRSAYAQCYLRLDRQARAVEQGVAVMVALAAMQRRAERALSQGRAG